MGDPVGLEGDTLVIETINMRLEQGLRAPDRQRSPSGLPASGRTRSGKFTVDDPGTYTQPFSGEVASTPPRARSTSTPATRELRDEGSSLAPVRPRRRAVDGNRGPIVDEGGN